MQKPVLGTTICAQIGILCHDIEATAKAYGEFLGQEYKISGSAAPEIAKTEYLGRPTAAGCKQAFFKIGDAIEIELIEPDRQMSTWRHDLDENGEGVHHIAFWVKDTDQLLMTLEGRGMKLLQKGGWPGGRYAYVDAHSQLKITLELLENLNG